MRKTAALASVALAALTALTGCGGPGSSPATPSPESMEKSLGSGSASVHPGTSGSCPADLLVDTPPERIVTLDGSAAAILVELGLGDRIVGTAGTDYITDFDGELRARLDTIPVLDDGRGNQEAVLDAKPDLVTAISAYSFGGFEGTPTVDTLAQNDSVVLAACGNRAGGENTTLENLYHYVRELAAAYDAADRGERLISDLQAGIESATRGTGEDEVPTLILTSIPDDGTGIVTRGGASYANAVVALAGGQSVSAGETGDVVELSAEQVNADNPALIVAVGGFGPMSTDELRAAVLSSPLLAATDAVRNDAVVIVPHRTLLSPNLLNVEAIAAISATIADLP